MKYLSLVVTVSMGVWLNIYAMEKKLTKPRILDFIEIEDSEESTKDLGGGCSGSTKPLSGQGQVLHARLTEYQKQLIEQELKRFDTEQLFYAVLNDNVKEVLYILISGYADVNAKTSIGWTPLHYAARDRNVRIVRVLLAVKGINTQSVNGSGHTVRQVVLNRRDCATEEHQALCDQILELLDAYEAKRYPYKIKGNTLIEIATGDVIETTK